MTEDIDLINFTASIIIPEQAFFMFIGTKGSQIKLLQDQTNTYILLRKNAEGMSYRPVDVKATNQKNNHE